MFHDLPAGELEGLLTLRAGPRSGQGVLLLLPLLLPACLGVSRTVIFSQGAVSHVLEPLQGAAVHLLLALRAQPELGVQPAVLQQTAVGDVGAQPQAQQPQRGQKGKQGSEKNEKKYMYE